MVAFRVPNPGKCGLRENGHSDKMLRGSISEPKEIYAAVIPVRDEPSIRRLK